MTTSPPLRPTPLAPVQLRPGDPVVWCKLEYLHPSGSTKDRVAGFVLDAAARRGELGPGATVVEASSGSTGIALAMACAVRGLRFVAVLPEGASDERLAAVRAYGGEVVLTPRAAGIRGCLAAAGGLARARGAFWPRQFSNPDSAEAHRRGTAPELLAELPGGRADAFASGVGTGGTLVGVARGLADAGRPAVPVLARPVNLRSAPDAECCSFSGRIPGVVDHLSELFREDEFPGLVTVEVDDREAMAAARELIRRGFPVGPSSGLNYLAAAAAARRLGPGAVVATVFPDRMERYFSTELFRPAPAGEVGVGGGL